MIDLEDFETEEIGGVSGASAAKRGGWRAGGGAAAAGSDASQLGSAGAGAGAGAVGGGGGRPLTGAELADVHAIVFPSSGRQGWNDAWRVQGFEFCGHAAVPYGLVQPEGGPCGVVAPVQVGTHQHRRFLS
jgi:hypothetical protein